MVALSDMEKRAYMSLQLEDDVTSKVQEIEQLRKEIEEVRRMHVVNSTEEVGRKELTVVTQVKESCHWGMSQLVCDYDTKAAEVEILQSLLEQNENAVKVRSIVRYYYLMARAPYQSHTMFNQILSFDEHPSIKSEHSRCLYALFYWVLCTVKFWWYMASDAVECVATLSWRLQLIDQLQVLAFLHHAVLVPEFTILNRLKALYSLEIMIEPHDLVHYLRLELVHRGWKRQNLTTRPLLSWRCCLPMCIK